MELIRIKPISVNKCWQGRRFKTPDYTAYRQELFYLLPKLEIPKGKLKVNIIWGLSSKSADIDNPIKPFLDALQDKYRFNDKMIYNLEISKQATKKGKEFIKFEITKNGI